MRIVHTEASCGWGGQEIRIIEESLGMQERGHQVLILCPPESRIFAEAPKRGVAVVGLPIGRKSLRGFLAVRRWLRSNPVDVLNTHSSTDSWLTALACIALAKAPPIVRTRHISAPVPKNWLTRWLYTRATKHIVTTGESLRMALIEENGFPEEIITSIPTGIDVSRFSPGSKTDARIRLGLHPERRYVGTLATLRSWKGHLYLLEAFFLLHKPDWMLVIVGDGPMKEVIHQRIGELDLQDRVMMAGQQDFPEDWLRCFDIFCLPSYANEGVPQAVLQAMMVGLPIVTTNVGAIPEAVKNGENGIVIEPRNVDGLVAALEKLMDNDTLAESYGGKAREFGCEKFSRGIMLERMEKVFVTAIQQV